MVVMEAFTCAWQGSCQKLNLLPSTQALLVKESCRTESGTLFHSDGGDKYVLLTAAYCHGSNQAGPEFHVYLYDDRR